MGGNNSKEQRRMMDGETAMAFAGHCFQQLHPKSSCPEWLGRCTTISYRKDESSNYIVSFALTPKATNDAVSYFTVIVDPHTAATTVLVDRDLADFVGEELHGFVPPRGSPWASD